MTSQDVKAKKANRRSAVERLEETKANYVKTESVLDCKQEFEHSSTLHVSTGPQIDVLLRGPIKSIYSSQSSVQYVQNINQSENYNTESLFMKRATLRSRSILETKPKAAKQEAESSKKLFTRDYDYCDVRHSDGEKRLKTTATIPKLSTNLTILKQTVKGNECAENEFAQRSKISFSQHCWEIPNNTIEKTSSVLDGDYLPIHGESEGEEPSTDDTRDSLSAADVMEFEGKCHGSRTSDYVSRSSSFKCSVPSDKVRNLVNRFETQLNKNKEPLAQAVGIEGKRKSVSRSKSDVSHRFPRSLGLVAEKKASNDADLERFFNTMGLDSASWNMLTSPPTSPVHFFDSISSLNSDDHLSSICSEDSTGEPKEGLTNLDLQRHAPTETSIVEKNARVVKWLYNCHNARRESSA